jgi:hypothetical protein
MAYRRRARDEGVYLEPHASSTARDEDDPMADVRDRLKALLNSRDYDEVSRMLDAYTASSEEADDDAEVGRPGPGEPSGYGDPIAGSPVPGRVGMTRAQELAAASVVKDRGRRANDQRLVLAMDASPDTVRGVSAFLAAKALVEPVVGPILAADSASDVMCQAIGRLGQDARGMHATALQPVFEALARSRHTAGGGSNVASVSSSPFGTRGISNPVVKRALSRIRTV